MPGAAPGGTGGATPGRGVWILGWDLGRSYLQSVGLTETGTGEDDDVKDDAEGVEDTEAADEVEKRRFEIQICFQEDQESDNIAWGDTIYHISIILKCVQEASKSQ